MTTTTHTALELDGPARGELHASVALGRVKVELDYIGEGYNGDYDPEDEDDEALYRLSVFASDTSGQWHPVENGSACTSLPVRHLRTDQLAAYALAAATAVKDNVDNGVSIKRIVEELSLLPDTMGPTFTALNDTTQRILTNIAD